jgi:hypothetical protein
MSYMGLKYVQDRLYRTGKVAGVRGILHEGPYPKA